jgi:hypothetical protein
MSTPRLFAAMAAVLLLAAGCTAGAEKPGAGPAPTPPPRATPAPAPQDGTCHQLTYADAVSPTAEVGTPLSCRAAHTSQTYAVGRLTTELDGHLVAVDSPRVQRQVRRTCPARLAAFLGASTERLRLSLLRAVWFSPTVAASDEGADWFRCDVIAVGGDEQLATLTGSLKGALAGDKDGYGMCGTAEPGAKGFRRVLCREPHTWRAVRTIPLDGPAYPGEVAARAAGQKPCQEAGQRVAKDALDYRWGYEWPTAQQWTAGQTYGICWAPVA